MLSVFLDLIKSKVFLAIIGTLAAVAAAVLLFLVWKTMGLRFFLLGLGGLLLCIMLIVAIVLLWKLLERRRGDRMEQALGQDGAAREQQRQQAKVAVQGIKDRWAEAMLTLKATKVRIYDLPWVLLIGEPQSGKTTTLRESGLDFPLGKDSLSGAGGTVNCDWWFTNEAVILDTAGRFTMPVDTAPDREEWLSFLKLLATHRPRCPINGVIVTIPATSLLQDSPETLKAKALTIRDKLQELVSTLGIEFPVNIMVSKLDLVYGFAEFCASLSAEERKQALGWNRRNMTPEAFNQEEYTSFFAALVDRLDSWAKRRLRELNPGPEADRVYAFPGEFNRLQDALASYLSLIFRPDRYHVSLLFRGCSFSSGLQEGRSIARALLEGAEAGDKAMLAEFAKSFVQSRAYFINAFYTRVFKERWLVRRAGGVTKRELILRLAAAGFALLFLAGAGILLASGYRTLATKVKPLETQALKAQALLTGTPGQEIPASEITRAITTLEAGRQDLISHGARLFLRASHNMLVEDLGRIEDALVERRLLDRLVAAAGRQYGEDKPITTLEEKQRLSRLLLQCLDLYAGKPVTLQSLSTLFDAIAWKSPTGLDIDRPEAERIIQGYPYAKGTAKVARQLQGGELYLRQMLGHLQRFWASFYALQWQEQKKRLVAINTGYTALLAFQPSAAVDRGEQVEQPFGQLAEAFLQAIAALDPKGSGKVAVWTEGLQEQCRAEYLILHDKFAETSQTEIKPMTGTVDRHAQVCAQLKSGIGSEWTTALEQNGHILAMDGTLNPEMFQVRDGVVKEAAFGPLLTLELKERLKAESENPLPLLDAMSQTWQTARSERLKDIGVSLDKVEHRGWQKKEFMALSSDLTGSVVLQAHQEAALAAVQVVLPQEALALSAGSGTDIPKPLRASWLAPRFGVLQKVSDWLQSRHPGSPGLTRVRSAIAGLMGTAWGNCVKFWGERLNTIDIAGSILRTSSWSAFRKEALNRRSLFIDRSVWPLNAFFEHMAHKDVAEIKTLMDLQGGSQLIGTDLQPVAQRVENTAALYSPAKYLPHLEEAQRSFNNVLENLTDDARVSWQMVKAGKPGDNVSLDKFKVLSDFYQRVSGDPAGRGEPLAMQLAKIDAHGASLLQKGFSAESGKEWGGFVGAWRARLGDKYPFGRRDGWIGGDTVANEIRKLIITTQTKNDLHDFFFAQEKGLEAFIKKYNLMANDPVSPEPTIQLDRAGRAFLEHCLAWREFLFDDSRQPRKHQLKITLDDQQGQDSRNAEKYFTQLLISGLEADKDKAIRLRFSGQRFKSASVIWEFSLNSEIYLEAKNEETGLTTAIRLSGGGLAFPAYVAWEGRRKQAGPSADLRLNMLFPKTGGTPGEAAYVVPISVNWDQKLPEPISWPGR